LISSAESDLERVLQAPILAVLIFGAYLALALLVGLLRFRTVPEEAELLQNDIARSKKALHKLGIS
jgi:hypothetical protein